MALNNDRFVNVIMAEFDTRLDGLVPVFALSAAAQSVTEGNSGTVTANFPVTRARALTRLDQVDYTVTPATSNPVSASDFAGGVFPSGSIIFGIDETSKNIPIGIAGDTSVEPTKGYKVTITLPGIGELGNAVASGTIVNDDQTPNPTPTASTLDASSKSPQIALSGGNLRAQVGSTVAAGNLYAVRSTIAKAAGDLYFEAVSDATGMADNAVGISDASAPFTPTTDYFGQGTKLIGIYKDGTVGYDGQYTSLEPFAAGDRVGVRLTPATGKVRFYKNGVLLAGQPAGGFSTGIASAYAYVFMKQPSAAWTVNFAPSVLPTGATSWDGGTAPAASIPDIAVGAPSPTVANARNFGPYDTDSTSHSFYFDYRDDSFKIVLARTDFSQLYPPLGQAIGINQGSGFIGFYRWKDGVSSTINVNPTFEQPPFGTPCAWTLNVDQTVSLTRLDTNAVLYTSPSWVPGYIFEGPVTGTGVSFHGDVGETYNPGGLDNVKAQANAVPLTISTLVVDQAFRPTITASYTGTNKTGYRLEKRYFTNGAAGAAIGAKVDAVVSVPQAGRLVLTAPINFGTEQYGSRVIVRVYEMVGGAETGVYRDTQPYTMPSVAITPLTMGYNLTQANYYIPFPMASDLARHAEIRPSGDKAILIPYSGINGTYDCEVAPGSGLIGPYLGSNQSKGITVTTVDAAAGKYTVVINQDHNRDFDPKDTDARGIEYYGPQPLQGFKMKMRGATTEVNPRWVSEVFGKGMRDLDVCSANYTPSVDYISASGWYDSFTLPIKAFAVKHAADPTFEVYHHVQGLVFTDDLVRREATVVRDHFPDNAIAKFIHELSNEVWSDGFYARCRTLIEGCREGFIQGGTPTAPGTKYVVKRPTQVGEYPNTTFVTPTMSAGETLIINNEGNGPWGSYNLIRTKTNLAAGSVIDATTFEHVAGLQDLLAGGLLWEGYRHNQICDIYKEVLGEERYNRQVLPAIYCQTGSSPKNREPQLEAVPGYRQKVKIIGQSAYLAHEPAIVQATSGLTPQILAQGFIDRVEPIRQDLLRHIADIRDMGPFQHGIYEGGSHPMNYAGGTDHYKGVYAQLEKSTLMAAVEYDWMKMIQETATGYVFYYNAFGGIWGLKRDWNPAVSHYRYDGHMAAINGQARPALT